MEKEVRFLQKIAKKKYLIPVVIAVVLLAAYATGGFAYVNGKVFGDSKDAEPITGNAVLDSIPGMRTAKNAVSATKQRAVDAVDSATDSVRRTRESVTTAFETVIAPVNQVAERASRPAPRRASSAPDPHQSIENDDVWAQQSAAHQNPITQENTFSPGTFKNIGIAAAIIAALAGTGVAAWKLRKKKPSFYP